MTVVNKVSVKAFFVMSLLLRCNTLKTALQYVVSGRNFSMNFLLLAIQSSVCVVCVLSVKKLRIISFRNFDMADAKAWFPISFLLVTVIYSGSKSLVC